VVARKSQLPAEEGSPGETYDFSELKRLLPAPKQEEGEAGEKE
jgi:hypothetical protein